MPGTSWGLSGEERPVLLPPGPNRVSAWPGLEVSLGRAEAGSSGGGFFLGGEQRLQAGSAGALQHPAPSVRSPRTDLNSVREAANGVLQQLLRSFPQGHLAVMFSF